MTFDKDELNTLFKKIDSYFLGSEDDIITTDKDQVYRMLFYSILERAHNLCVNLYIDNIDSFGLDYDCKAIIEGILIYRIVTRELDNQQISLLCYSYSVVDYGDKDKYEHYLKRPYNYPKYIPSDSDKFFSLACSYFDCTKEQLLKSGKLKEPYFYLSHSLEEKVDILTYLDKYGLGLNNPLEEYKLFSHNTHPTLNLGPTFLNDYESERENCIIDVLHLVESFVDECVCYSANYDDMPSISDHIDNEKEFFDDVDRVSDFCTRFATHVPDGLGSYSWYYFQKMGPLLKDMFYSFYFECPECIASRYHLTLEMSSVFYYLIYNPKVDTYDDRLYREDGLIVYSCYSLKDGQIDSRIIPSMERDLYKSYFKDAYSPISEKQFKTRLEKSSSFALDKEFGSYKPLIDLFLKDYFHNHSRYQRSLYQLSLDILSSGGNYYDFPYDYNESVTGCLGNTLFIVSCFIQDFITLINENRNRKVKYKKEMNAIDRLLDFLDYRSYLSYISRQEEDSLPDAEA